MKVRYEDMWNRLIATRTLGVTLALRRAAVGLVVLGLLTAGVAEAAQQQDREKWSVDTPTPDGQTTCSLQIGGDTGSAPGALTVSLKARDGEARIPELGIAAGNQEGCDSFPNFPNVTKISVGPGLFFFDLTLELHAHPGDQCEVGGESRGKVRAFLSGPSVIDVSIEVEERCAD